MTYRLAIIDDSIPNAFPSSFRNYEFNLILNALQNADIWTMSPTKPGKDAWFHHSYGQEYDVWKKNKKAYLTYYPENENRIHWLDTQETYSFDLAYSVFLCTTYTLLPFYERNKIPFVFVLYPGGGFGLDNSSSDTMLKKICNSPFFRGVVCTQPVTYQYLIDKNFTSKEKILYQFGGYVQFKLQDIPQKLYYPQDKTTLDICFVAWKYSAQGVDKGYDLFIDCAKRLSIHYPFLHFHVVGNFDEQDIPVTGLENRISFHGALNATQLAEFYAKMDICLSPNRPFKLFEGNFDGFPLGLDATCFGTVLMTTDELRNNQGYYIDGKELIIIRPDVEDIYTKMEALINNPKKMYTIGKSGAKKTFKLMDPQKRAEQVIDFLKQNLKPKLSVCCITYNHAKFIRQTLDSFLMQKTNFPFEIVIHDDASTDGTADIIREYEEKYPDIIKPIYQKENQFSKGKMPIVEFMLDKMQGKYVAFCEGDDYWTDPLKLQKQVDFLEEHPDFSICFHPVKVIWEDHSNPDSVFPEPNFRFNKEVLTLDDLLAHNFIQTNSVVYRWNLTKKEWPKEDFLPCDYLFHLIHASKGKIGFLDDVMAIYRKHDGGVWYGCGQTDEWFIRCGVKHARFYQIIHRMFGIDIGAHIQCLLFSTCNALINHKLYAQLGELMSEYPDIGSKFIESKQQNIQNLITQNTQYSSHQKYLEKKVKKLKKKKHILICAAMLLFVICVVQQIYIYIK